jgi:hypothetical protein
VQLLCVPHAAAALPSEAEAVAAYKASTADGLEPCLALLKKAATDKSVQPQLVEGECGQHL